MFGGPEDKENCKEWNTRLDLKTENFLRRGIIVLCSETILKNKNSAKNVTLFLNINLSILLPWIPCIFVQLHLDPTKCTTFTI
jgi:hypothetical protein